MTAKCIDLCAHSRAMNENISAAKRNSGIACPFLAALIFLILGPKMRSKYKAFTLVEY